MSFLIENANADTAPAAASTSTTTTAADSSATPPMGQADMIGSVLPFVIVFVAIYFLIMRPQQKKFKLHQAMVAGIQKGDEVVTSGGIIGKVKNVEGQGFVQVEIAKDVVVRVLASTISTIVGDKPVNDNKIEKKKSA